MLVSLIQEQWRTYVWYICPLLHQTYLWCKSWIRCFLRFIRSWVLQVLPTRMSPFLASLEKLNSVFLFKPWLMHPLSKPCSAVPSVKNCTLMLAPILRRKVVPEKWVTLPTESTLASLYMRNKGDPFLRANSARAHALIVQNGSYWPGWVSQSVFIKKSWPG